MKNTQLIGWLYQYNAQVNLNISEKDYLQRLGLSKDQYYTRAMAARVMGRFPEYKESYRNGEVGLSALAMVAPKITDANQAVILEHIRGKTKRQTRCFLSKVDCHGFVNNREGTAEITLTLKESDLEKLEEARAVLSSGGKVPTNGEVFLRAIEDLLDRRDPVRRAQRAKVRSEKKQVLGSSDRSAAGAGSTHKKPSDRNEQQRSVSPPVPDRSESLQRIARPPIPRQTQHNIWLRDGRRCTHRYPDGDRCEETMMLELDHISPWSRCRTHVEGNLRVVCRRHNQRNADLDLGSEFMGKFRQRPGYGITVSD